MPSCVISRQRKPFPDKTTLCTFIEDIRLRIGDVGDQETRLAVVLGPLSFDHADAEVAQFIELAFGLALETNVAVGFHIDDSMFWSKQEQLKAKNFEDVEKTADSILKLMGANP